MRRSKPARVPLEPQEAALQDGSLEGDAARRAERTLIADPLRRAAFERDRSALDIWVGEARASALDPQEVARNVLARVAAAGRVELPRGELLAPRAALAWTVAALLLLGVGAFGTWSVRARRAEALPSQTQPSPVAPGLDPDAPLLDGVMKALRAGMVRRSSPVQPAPAPANEVLGR